MCVFAPRAVETEHIGADILTDLDKQKSTIQGARDRLAGANVQLARSKKLLGGMTRRAAANKALMVVIIIILMFMIILIIYLQWFAGSGSSSPSPSPPPAPPGSPPTHHGRLRMHR